MQPILQLQQQIYQLQQLQHKHNSLFEWHDGALVQAMKEGDVLLIDEISLADDAVLERLNSVLEPLRFGLIVLLVCD
jgi:midasin